MCFSAEASFGAAVIIGTVGVVAYKKAKDKPQKIFAFIPILFAIQQLSEGFVWLASSYDSFSGLLEVSSYSFIIFAWVIWPLYIPYSIWNLEKEGFQKKILRVLMFIGTFVVLILSYVLVNGGINAEIVDCSITYSYGAQYSPYWLFTIFYLMTTAVPNLISSTRKVWILGITNVIMFSVTKIYFNQNAISIWCFFAAISSVLILLIITDLNKKEASTKA